LVERHRGRFGSAVFNWYCRFPGAQKEEWNGGSSATSRENRTKGVPGSEQKVTKGTKILALQATAAESTSFPSLTSGKGTSRFHGWWRAKFMKTPVTARLEESAGFLNAA
jgi:hypothetical protein